MFDLGKVDEIATVGHVTTTFRHLYFLPIYPIESRFIKYFGNDLQGIPIKVNLRSALKGYALFYLGLATAIIGAIAFSAPTILTVCLAVLVAVLFIGVSRLWPKANYETARALSDHVGLNLPTKLIIENIYQKITDKELEQYIADYESGVIDDRPKRSN